MVSVRDLEWAAGFLEGEGSFTLCPNIRVAGYQNEREPLERLRRLFGGSIVLPKGLDPLTHRKRRCHHWVLTGKRAAGMMMTLYGLMSVKRKTEIRHAITDWLPKRLDHRDKTHCPAGHPYATIVRVHGKFRRRRCVECHRAGRT